MKHKKILVIASCFILALLCFPAMANAQSHWQQGNNAVYDNSQKSSDGAADRLRIKSWNRDQYRAKNSPYRLYRTSNERGYRSPGNNDARSDNSGSGDEYRRPPRQSNEARPPRQERREQRPDHRRPDTRHNDRGHTPKRDDRRHDKKHDKRRPDDGHKQHRPDTRHRDRDYDRNRRHDHRQTPYYPPRYDHRHNHRPKHRLHKRHKYIYYYTPWYNTWFLAPILWHYPRVGFMLEVLPASYIRIVISGTPYYYASGSFYRRYDGGYVVVAAPIGAVVTTLPEGYIAFSLGLDTYYFVNDTYYVWDEPRDGFVVVPKPEGASEAMGKATQGRLYVYPKQGQSEEQQAKDRYACHLWAVSESGVDPTVEETEFTDREKRDYKRAIAACLEGRGYTVK